MPAKTTNSSRKSKTTRTSVKAPTRVNGNRSVSRKPVVKYEGRRLLDEAKSEAARKYTKSERNQFAALVGSLLLNVVLLVIVWVIAR
jgi:cobalamin biosynthesis Mg chelatase CobN